jgi:hypothetical protein
MAATANNNNEAQSIPFDEFSDGATVRYTMLEGKPYMSVHDIIMCACGKDNDQAGKVWRDLSFELKNGLRRFLSRFQFLGHGQSAQPVITFQGALKLIMLLPGKNARSTRSKINTIVQRHFAGDKSPVAEIQANAMSDNPIPRLARQPLAEDNAITDDDDDDNEAKSPANRGKNKRTRQEFERESMHFQDAEIRFEIIKQTFNLFQQLSPNGVRSDDAKTAIRSALIAHINALTCQIPI